MGWTLTETAATIIECWIYADFMVRFLRPARTCVFWISWAVILLMNILLTLFFNGFMIFEGELGIIRITMNLILACLLLKGSMFEKMLASFITDASVIIINLTTMNVLGSLFSKTVEELITERGMLRLTTLFITKFLFFLFTRVLIRFKQKDKYFFAPIEWISLSILFVVTIFVEIEIFHLSLAYELSTQSPSAIGAALGLIAINILAYTLMRRISFVNVEKTELLIDKMQLELYKTQLADSEKQYTEMRQIRHDMKNHLQCISLLLQDGQTDKAQAYVDDMMENKLNFGYAGVRTGHRVVDIMANSKLSQCSKEGIKTAVNISPFVLEMDDVDVCILLGNLFDNAMEACRNTKGERCIYFAIGQRKGYTNFVIRNSIGAPVLAQNPELHTTKKEKKLHGVGLKSVKDTVQKYGGMMEFYEKNREFTADVWLPSKKCSEIYQTGKFHAE